jgi:hypothetical protein
MTSRHHKDLVGKAINTLDELHVKFINYDDYEGSAKALGARDDLLLVWREMKVTTNDPTTMKWTEEGETIIEVDPNDPNLWPYNQPPHILEEGADKDNE